MLLKFAKSALRKEVKQKQQSWKEGAVSLLAARGYKNQWHSLMGMFLASVWTSPPHLPRIDQLEDKLQEEIWN